MRTVMFLVVIATTAGCGGISKEQYQTKEAEAAKYKQASESESSKAAELESKVTDLESHTKSQESTMASLQQENATLQAHAADLEKKLGESSAATAALEEKRLLRVNDTLLFKENSSKLTTESKHTLDTMADAIRGKTDNAIIVSGFTDGTEAAGTNASSKRWQLSSARALEVAKYLASRGIDPARIAVAGFGPARPVAANDSLSNRSMNRRVEILLAPLNQSFEALDVKPAELMQKGTGHSQGE